MSNYATIFNKLSDDNFRVQAFAEYATRAQERFTNLIKTCTDLPTLYNAELESVPSDETIRAMVADVMEANNVPDGMAGLSGGFIKIKDLLFSMLKHMMQTDVDTPLTASDVYQDITLLTTDATGEVSHPTVISMARIGDELQAQLHSVACLAAGAAAFVEGKGVTANAITIFNDKLSDLFINANADISNTAQYVKTVLSEVDPIAFLRRIISDVGILKVADATPEEDVLPNDCEIAEYTGVSPGSALSLSPAVNVIVGTAVLAAQAVKGIFTSLTNLKNKVFKAVTEGARKLFVDPDDLVLAVEGGFGTIDGFAHSSPQTISFSKDTVLWTAAIAKKYANKWIALKTRFGEWCIRINQVTEDDDRIDINWEYQYKPRVLNFDLANSLLLDPSATISTYSDIAAILDGFSGAGDALYEVDGMSERDRYRGYIAAMELDAAFIGYAFRELSNITIPSPITPSSLVKWDPSYYGDIPSIVTNLDWVKAASGWDPQFETFGNGMPYNLGGRAQGATTIHATARRIFDAFLIVMQYENDNPTEESPFVPFSNNHTSFNKPSYVIRTDNDNAEAFNLFVNTVTTIIVYAIIAVATVVVVKKLTRAVYFRCASVVGQLDSAMWSGRELTAAEQKQYVRASRLMSRVNVFSSSLMNHTSSTNNESKLNFVEEIKSLIK